MSFLSRVRRSAASLPIPPLRLRQAGTGGAGAYVSIPVPDRLVPWCANPACQSGWLHLWRSRSRPVFEDGWTCSPECTQACLSLAVARETIAVETGSPVYRHRIPLGLLLLEQEWIQPAQLRRALEAQRSAGEGRIGFWLLRQNAISEEMLARALALQWSCPVLRLAPHDPQQMASVMPRLFVESSGALPLRVVAQRLVYLGFEEALDPALAFAVQHVLNLQVESGIVPESGFKPAHARMMGASFPPLERIEAVSLPAAADALARCIEQVQPAQARLVRVHEWLWLRMWLRDSGLCPPERESVLDAICSIGALEPTPPAT